MKNILLVTLLSFAAYGQENIQNGGFENWTVQDNNEIPDHWINLNWSSSPDSPSAVSKTTDAHSGNFAAKCVSYYDPTLQTTLSGTMLYGMMDPINGMSPVSFESRPDSLVFWVKYTPQNNSQYIVVLSLTKWNTQSSSTDYIGFASSQSGSTLANYTRVSVPFTYISQLTPDTISLSVQTAVIQNAPGIELYIDDIALIYNDVSTKDASVVAFSIFPNPVTDELRITSEIEGAYTLYTIDGKPVSSGIFNTGSNSLDMKWLNSGTYILRTDTGYYKQFVKL